MTTQQQATSATRARAPLTALAVWAFFVVAFLALRPAKYTPLFWLLLVPAFLAGGLAMWLQHLQTAADRRAHKQWRARLNSLAVDIGDEGHLYEALDPSEWDRVFRYLEARPPTMRNLRDAMSAIAPDYIDGQ